MVGTEDCLLHCLDGHKHGVYEQPEGGKPLGLHATKIIGWGFEGDDEETGLVCLSNSSKQTNTTTKQLETVDKQSIVSSSKK